MESNGLIMTPIPDELLYIYDQNFNPIAIMADAYDREFEDERITRSKGKEILTFKAVDTSTGFSSLTAENLVKFGERWYRIKYAEDDPLVKGITTFTCYALWYELAEGMPKPLQVIQTTVLQAAQKIVEPLGKWVELSVAGVSQAMPVRGMTLKENSALYKLRYLAKQYNLELTFGYKEIIENELRYVKTVIMLQPYQEERVDFPLVVENNLKHIVRTEDSRNLCTAYKISGKSNEEGKEFTFAEINGGNDYLVDTSWFTERGMRARIIPKSKQDDRFKIKQSMLDAARAYLDIYSKPLISYEASAVLYSRIPSLHSSQLVIDDSYKVTEWRKVTGRKINYDDLATSTIIFDDPRQNLIDLLNDDGDGMLSGDSSEDTHTVIRFADDAKGTGMNANSGKYIGVLTTTRPVEDLTPYDFTWIKIEGPEGRQGQPGLPGRDGVDGKPGKAGASIIQTDVMYAISVLGTRHPEEGWQSQVPELIKGRYIWTRMQWRYSDGNTEYGYSVSYIPQDGRKGDDGLPGKDGVGIASTKVQYAASESGTNPPTDWFTTIVPDVPAGHYLWTKTTWKYTDNSEESGYSVSRMGERGPQGIPGLQGVPGAAGKSSRVHIAYADSENGAGMSLVDQNKNYIGIYQDFEEADSTDPTRYKWTRWKGQDGAQGLPGKAGADGKTPYLHFAYADSANGTVNFSLEPQNQRYQGYYADYAQQDSLDPSRYTWVDRLAKVDIGVVNLLRRSKGPFKPNRSQTDNWQVYPDSTIKLVEGKTYSIKATSNATFTDRHPNTANKVNIRFQGNLGWKMVSTDTTALGSTFVWDRPTGVYAMRVNSYDTTDSKYIEKIMVVQGNVPMDWQPAPEDVEEDLANKAPAQLTADQIRALEEKAKLHQTQLEAKLAMTQFSEFEKAYRDYIENAQKQAAQSEADLADAGRRLNAVVQQLGGLKELKTFIDTYMSSSNEGLVIGKNDGTSSFRVTSDRISMYSAGREVMYINQGFIHINNGVFMRSIRIGNFVTEQHPLETNVNVCRFVE